MCSSSWSSVRKTVTNVCDMAKHREPGRRERAPHLDSELGNTSPQETPFLRTSRLKVGGRGRRKRTRKVQLY